MPNILNNPINAKANPAKLSSKLLSFKKAGKCVETNVTWNPHTKNPEVSNL